MAKSWLIYQSYRQILAADNGASAVVDERQPLLNERLSQLNQQDRGRHPSIIIICVTCITGISSALAGVVIVAIPTIAKDLKFDRSLELWFVHVFFRYIILARGSRRINYGMDR